MKRETEELMQECIAIYREIDEIIAHSWNDEAGCLIRKIMNDEKEKTETYFVIHQEQDNE